MWAHKNTLVAEKTDGNEVINAILFSESVQNHMKKMLNQQLKKANNADITPFQN